MKDETTQTEIHAYILKIPLIIVEHCVVLLYHIAHAQTMQWGRLSSTA